MMSKSQITEILTPDFTKELLSLETAKEVQSALQEKGMDLSLDEISKIKDLLNKQADGQEELSETDLEDVAGGDAGIVIGIIGIVIGLASWADARFKNEW